MQNEMLAAQEKYFAPQIVTIVLHLVLTTLMIIGGIGVLQSRPGARALLMWTLLAVIIFEVIRAGLGIMIQLELLPIQQEYNKLIMREVGGGQNQRFVQMIGNMSQGFAILGIIMGLMWPLGKIIVYGLSARYLASDKIIAWFESARAKEPANP
jgi:hypothetical protein